jgi:hypothetical protein
VRGSRQARAIAKSTRFGRREQEAAWKNAEVDALYNLTAAGVRVPKPYGYFNDTLIMELVTDAAGRPAPRLGEVDLSPETAREYHSFLIAQIVRMLSIGLIHGDLSEFNVLVGSDGPALCTTVEVYDQRLPPDRALGARDRSRCDAGSARSGSDADAGPTADGGAPVRHHQGVDGRHPLPQSTTTESQRRDGPSRPGLQPEASDENHGNRTADRGAPRLIDAADHARPALRARSA